MLEETFLGAMGYSSRDLDVMSFRELSNANKGYQARIKQDYMVQRRMAYIVALPHYKKNMLTENKILSDEFLNPDYKPKKKVFAKFTKIDNGD